MPSSTPTSQSLEAVHWREEPHHKLLSQNDEYTIFAGHLPAHQRCALHSHYHPTLCVALMDIFDVTDHVVSDPIRRDQKPSPISFQQGTILSYNCTESNPHIHEYWANAHPSLFLAIESPLGRTTGSPTPPIPIDVLPNVSVRHEAKDVAFASAVILTLPPGCTAKVHVKALDDEKVLCRLMTSLSGPTLDLLDVRFSPDLQNEHVCYEEIDPPKLAFALSNFSCRPDVKENTTLTNKTAETAEIVVLDYFTMVKSTECS